MSLYWSDLHISHKNSVRLCARPFVRQTPEGPEPDLERMDALLLQRWQDAMTLTWPLYTLGDVSLGMFRQLRNRYGTGHSPVTAPQAGTRPLAPAFTPGPQPVLPLRPDQNVLVCGNHDMDVVKRRAEYLEHFGAIVGTHETWQTNTLVVRDYLARPDGATYPVAVLLSHDPQRDLQGCDYNLYGHHHDNALHYPDYYRDADLLWFLEDPRYINVGVEMLDYRPRTLAALVRHRQVCAGPDGRGWQMRWPGTETSIGLWPERPPSDRVKGAAALALDSAVRQHAVKHPTEA